MEEKKIAKDAADGKSEEQMDVWMNKQMGVREEKALGSSSRCFQHCAAEEGKMRKQSECTH